MNNTAPHHVVVIGAGLSGLCAALAAREAGATVIVCEAAPREFRGGSSTFANGSFRIVHDGYRTGGDRDLAGLVNGHDSGHEQHIEVDAYTGVEFHHDMWQTTRGRTNETELRHVIDESYAAMQWLANLGVKLDFNLNFTDVDLLTGNSKITLDAGAALVAKGGGPAMMSAMFTAAEAAGIEIEYESSLDSFIVSRGVVHGVRVVGPQGSAEYLGTVILATGGFEANPQMRRKYLGRGWDLVPVRGSKYNTGTGLQRALDIGALAGGHWGGCHAVPTDFDIPLIGDLELSPRTERYSYPEGILVNEQGKRFIDEGEDNFTMTYAKVGEAICEQPGAIAYQIFDARSAHRLHSHYYERDNAITADSIDELAQKIGMPASELTRTIQSFNEACSVEPHGDEVRYVAHPSAQPPKSQWAFPIETGPYVAYKVTASITFTFGGILTDDRARVTHNGGHAIPGLFAAGGVVGGLFYFNYPAATSLTRAVVMGRIAGSNAAAAHSNEGPVADPMLPASATT